MKYIETIPCMAALLPGCDHADVKTVEGNIELEPFIRRMFTYRPVWLRGFYAVRGIIARMLHLKHDELNHDMKAEEMDLHPGGAASFFASLNYAPGRYWLGNVQDKHLEAWVGIARRPLDEANPSGPARFHVLTVVRHKHWTGPVYFTLIKPFHHLIVWLMARDGVRSG